MPANIPGIATKVPQSKLYIGLFLITVYTLTLNNTDRPSAMIVSRLLWKKRKAYSLGIPKQNIWLMG